jgi:hypothetical protein
MPSKETVNSAISGILDSLPLPIKLIFLLGIASGTVFYTALKSETIPARALILNSSLLVSVLCFAIVFLHSLTFHRRKINDDSVPDHYDFNYLKKTIEKQFGKETPFIVVQYGSSVSRPHKSNDEDYIVLVHGVSFDENSEREHIGHSLRSPSMIEKPIDIQIILMDSFMIGLIMGKPFEISVALDGVIKNSYLINKDYFYWFKSLANNILIDTKYLSERISADLYKLQSAFSLPKNETQGFVTIIAAYHYFSDLIKIKALKHFPEKVNGPSIYPLSQANTLVEFIDSERGKELYNSLVGYFKRNSVPALWIEFVNETNELSRILENE